MDANGNRRRTESTSLLGRVAAARITFNKYVIFAASAIVSALIASSVADANPDGGVVAGGQASISSPDSNTVVVNQTSDKAIIDWSSFNINPNETTRFQQPSSNSITLNRVNPANGASNILGALTANGQIWIINPAGILFGASARVDVAGLLATTANITNEDFMAGNYHFIQSPGWNGGIVNEGRISIHDEGMAALVAPGVENSGVIRATLGKVALSATNEFTVDFYGDQLINFSVNSEVKAPAIDPRTHQPMKDGVNNSGKIFANGGSVLMSAQVASNVLDHTINMKGVVEANTIAQHNGSIVLMGGTNGKVSVTGKLIAKGKRSGQTGGTVKVLGNQVVLSGHAYVNTSGMAGGGEILIGGNAHGGGLEQNADYTYVGVNTQLISSALHSGNGGKIVVWSNDNTQFYGSITATGGAISGNGGWVETSGHNTLSVSGSQINLSALKGSFGTWLLDPADITISDIPYTSGITLGSNTYTPDSGVAVSNIYSGDLGAALHTANVVITTTNSGSAGAGSGNITIDGVANLQTAWVAGDNTTLTLNAGNNIVVNAPINLAGTGKGLTLNAGNTTSTGTITINSTINGSLGFTMSTQTAGSITVNAAIGGSTALNSVSMTGGTAATGTTLNANVTTTGNQTYATPVTVGGAISLTGNTITLPAVALGTNILTIDTASATSAITGIMSSGAGGGLTESGAGILSMTAANTYSGATTVNGSITLSGAGTAVNSAFTVNDGGKLTLDNAGTAISTRIGTGTVLTMNGGEFVITGNASSNIAQTIGTLSFTAGYSTVTLSPTSTDNVRLTVGTYSRTAGATELFRGINLGANTVASSTANSSNITFTTTAPTLTGTGNSGTNTVGIIAGAIGAGGATGNTSSGTDFVTYNPTGGAVNGIRPLAAAEYTTTIGTGVNLKVSANSSPNTTATINSLLLTGGFTFTVGSGGGGKTVTISSGNVLSTSGTNIITGRAGDALAFGTVEGKFFAVGNLTSTTTPFTGTTGGFSTGGAGTILFNVATTLQPVP